MKQEITSPSSMKLEDLKPDIQERIRRHVHPLAGTGRAEILEVGPGHAKIAVTIGPDCLNYYGNLHGGFLFTLCDSASGMATTCLEQLNVTQNSSIQFIRGASQGRVYVEANSLHIGKRSVVNQVTATDQDGTLLVTATFTMCLLGPFSDFKTP